MFKRLFGISLMEEECPQLVKGQAMVNEALMYGEGFVPGPGQVIAVICDAGEEKQITFIEVKRSRLVGGEVLSVNGLEVISPFLPAFILMIIGVSVILFRRSTILKLS